MALPASEGFPVKGQCLGGLSDSEIVLRSLSDPRGFGPLYERYADRVYRYALQRVGSHEAADDIVSETMIAALENLDHYDPDRGAFAAWLFTIASRRVADHHRLHARFWRTITRRWRPPPAPSDETTDQVLRRYEYEAVQEGLATLSATDREILVLRYGSDLTSQEIGQILNMTDGHVRVRLQRARQRLATVLEEPS